MTTATLNDRIAASVERAKVEILTDIRDEAVPVVESFSELHDYVDANEYGGLCDEPHPYGLEGEEWLQWGNAVQEALNIWIVGGGLRDSDL